MKKIAFAAIALAAAGACLAQSRQVTPYTAPPVYSGYGVNNTSNYVAPHVTQNGTYVQGHMRSNPNSTTLDNYSTRGNVNPYTGKAGTVDPYTPRSSKKF